MQGMERIKRLLVCYVLIPAEDRSALWAAHSLTNISLGILFLQFLD